MSFVSLRISQKVADAATIWRFREDLTNAVIVGELFVTLNSHLRTNSVMAMKGQIENACIVSVPKNNVTAGKKTPKQRKSKFLKSSRRINGEERA